MKNIFSKRFIVSMVIYCILCSLIIIKTQFKYYPFLMIGALINGIVVAYWEKNK